MEDNMNMIPEENNNGQNPGEQPGTAGEKKPNIIVRIGRGVTRAAKKVWNSTTGRVVTIGGGLLLLGKGVKDYGDYRYEQGKKDATPIEPAPEEITDLPDLPEVEETEAVEAEEPEETIE